MWRFRRNLYGVLVTAWRRLHNVRGKLHLLHEAFGRAAAKVNRACHTGFSENLRHVQNILHYVELEVVLLVEARSADAYGERAIHDGRAEDWHARFVSGGEHAVFRCNLGQFPAKHVQKLARRVRARLVYLVSKTADPFFSFVILLIAGKQIPHAAYL